MPGFDLTNIGGAKEDKPKVEQLDNNTLIIGEHQVKRRGSVTKQELNKSAWTGDNFERDGQIRARPDDGKVDPNTQVIPVNENDPRELGSRAYKEAIKKPTWEYLKICRQFEDTLNK